MNRPTQGEIDKIKFNLHIFENALDDIINKKREIEEEDYTLPLELSIEISKKFLDLLEEPYE